MASILYVILELSPTRLRLFPQTVASLESFILLMICHPSVQKIAQNIVDKAYGGGRLPELSDRGRGDLVYIEALLMELHR